MKLFLTISILFCFFCHAFAMEPSPFINAEKLKQIIPLMFKNCSHKEAQTCWKAIYTVVFSEHIEMNKDLCNHHTDHHLLMHSKPKAPFNDPHEIRVLCKKDEELSYFRSLVSLAKKVLSRRLNGEFPEYLPFSLAAGCLEIPLAPLEEDSILHQWSFVHRKSQDPKKKRELWEKCLTRAKSIGLQICPTGIISIYLSLEGNDLLGKETFNVEDTSNRVTSAFSFMTADLSSEEKIAKAFSQVQCMASLSIGGVSSKKTDINGLLSDIIYNPLQGLFARKVSELDSNISVSSEHFAGVLKYAKDRLKQRLLGISPLSRLFAYEIAKGFEYNRPSSIKLSHISRKNPALKDFIFTPQNRQDSDRKLYNSYKFLYRFVDACESEADVFSMAELFAKSELIVLQNFQGVSSDGNTERDLFIVAIEASAREFQEARHGKPDIMLTLDDLPNLKFEYDDDTELRVQFPHDKDPIIVRAYHEPESNINLLRLKTGGDNNMCALLALGALTKQDVENIVKIFKKEEVLESIVSGDGSINYTGLWEIVGRNEQIWEDDTEWWGSIAAALGATIHIYQHDEEHKLICTSTHGNGGNRVIHIFLRTGHYSALIPATDINRIKDTILCNSQHSPMF